VEKNNFTSQHQNNITKYPNLINILNNVRSFSNSNADPERIFFYLINNLKIQQAFMNLLMLFVFKFALKMRRETCINVKIQEKYLFLVSANRLYISASKNLQYFKTTCCGYYC